MGHSYATNILNIVVFDVGRFAYEVYTTAAVSSSQSRRARKSRNQREGAHGRKVENTQFAGKKEV